MSDDFLIYSKGLKIVRVYVDPYGRQVKRCVNLFNPERCSYSMQLHRSSNHAASDREW
jgi:hypothetical protein